MLCFNYKATHYLNMWKEELDIIIQEGGVHEIEYKLRNNEVITFMIRDVSYYGQYCIVADSCTHSPNSFRFPIITHIPPKVTCALNPRFPSTQIPVIENERGKGYS